MGDFKTKHGEDTSSFFTSPSIPTTISIPSANITSELKTVGTTTSGGIDTPKGDDFDKAAWFDGSPAPGQYGASVIVGHVDSYESDGSASVFYNLHTLKPGDPVSIARQDGRTVRFEVYALRQYSREHIPADDVYLPHSDTAELRLITCSGTFDTATGEYSDNIVVFARAAPGQ